MMKYYPERGALIPIKLVDGGLKHCVYSSNPAIPTYSKYIVWDRNVSETENVVFYTDDDILKPRAVVHHVRVAWLSEPFVNNRLFIIGLQRITICIITY